MDRVVTVADCERVQAAWFETRLQVLGGSVHEIDGQRWLVGPDGVRLMFPARVSAAGLALGRRLAREHGGSVGVWLGNEVDTDPLAGDGFECGWSPWWMTAPMSRIGAPDDDRVVLAEVSDDRGDYDEFVQDLVMSRARPKHTWFAAAHTPRSHEFAGHALSHVVRDGAGHGGALAGLFDMEVLPHRQRQGFGTGLLRAACAGAAAAGATDVVLNATPEGKALYETCGFRQIGEGITWWWHPRRGRRPGTSPTLVP